MTFKTFTSSYFTTLHTTLETLDFTALEEFKNMLENLNTHNKVYVIGNGGSAATASHMVNDFGIGLKRRNKLSINIASLSDNTAVCSAIANDTGYENIFYLQLKDIIKPDDILVAISCSGNSPNILKASQYAQEVGANVVALSGFENAKVHQYSDLILHAGAEEGNYGVVEDVHMIINHLLYSWFIFHD